MPVVAPVACQACDSPLDAPFMVPVCTACVRRVLAGFHQLEERRRADLPERIKATVEMPERPANPIGRKFRLSDLKQEAASNGRFVPPSHPDCIG